MEGLSSLNAATHLNAQAEPAVPSLEVRFDLRWRIERNRAHKAQRGDSERGEAGPEPKATGRSVGATPVHRGQPGPPRQLHLAKFA
jgi:hypothetical protein